MVASAYIPSAVPTPQDGSYANLPRCLAGLNEQQLAAATATEGFLRVIAGAGTGKTRLLTHRFAYLVEGLGIDPANICCVTFTNKAANEMRQRIRALLGDGFDTSLVCTFHSLAARILREDIDHLFWPKAFQIIDRDQQKEVLAEVYEQRELKMDAGSFEKIIDRIELLKCDPSYAEGLLSREPCQIAPVVGNPEDAIVEAYLQRQKRDYLLDFDDLLVLAQRLLDTCPAVRERWQQKLSYIQVDEFQDSDASELRFVDTLAGYYGNVMVVGDPDQNVYEWRGSDVKLLVDFDREHTPCTTMFLTQNYRSTPAILNCANTLIARNQLRVPKDLTATRPQTAPVVHLHAASETEETAWVAERIAQAHRDGMPYGSVAILFRAAWVSRPIEKRLMDLGIPYEVVGGVRFMRRMEIADTVAYLRLAAFDDDAAFKRVANVPRRKLGKARLRHVEKTRDLEAAEGRHDGTALHAPGAPFARPFPSLLATMAAHLGDLELKGSGARRFVELVEELRDRMGRLGVADFVDFALTATGYETYIRELGNMDRLDNLAEFKRMAREFEVDAGEAVSIYDFLDMLALQAENPQDSGDRVRLMTIHAAKGLEFPCVFVMGMTEGVFPSSRTLEEREALGLEEERRLCYVALTRARDLLVLTESEGFAGGRSPKAPSRFLYEMGEEHYERIGTVPEALAQRTRAFLRSDGALGPGAGATSWEGRRVVHPVFGPGTIGQPDDNGSAHQVAFDGLPTPRYLSDTFLKRLLSEQEQAPSQVAVAATVLAEKPTKTGPGRETPHDGCVRR